MQKNSDRWIQSSRRKQPTFGDATTDFPAKWRLRNECKNFILMTRHYPDLGGASDWLNQTSHMAWPIRSTAQIWVVTRHQYGIYALVSLLQNNSSTSTKKSVLGPTEIWTRRLLLGVTVHEFMLISICQCLCHIMIVSWSHGFIGLVVSVVS